MALSRRGKKRATLIGGVAAAAVAVGATFVVVSAAVDRQTPPPVSDKVAQAYKTGVALPTTSKDNRPLAAFIGDSYTQGRGASSEQTNWVALVAKTENWQYENLGRGGTGYVTTSDENGCGLSFCPAIPAMVDLAVSDKPSVVVVAGGQNDLDTFLKDPAKVKDAVNATFKSVRAKLPGAQIVAVGPTSPWGDIPQVVGLNQVVQDAAKSVNAKFVSLVSPNVIAPDMILSGDKAHVNDKGHAAIAARVEAALR